MTRILIVDDQPMYRIGLAAILGAQDDLTIVGEAGDGQEAIARARSLQPDVVLMDVRMPNLNGIEATRAIAAAANDGGHPTRVVMLTTFDVRRSTSTTTSSTPSARAPADSCSRTRRPTNSWLRCARSRAATHSSRRR